MDPASIIATLTPELRAEVLLEHSQDAAFMAELPPLLQQEARSLRRRQVQLQMQHHAPRPAGGPLGQPLPGWTRAAHHRRKRERAAGQGLVADGRKVLDHACIVELIRLAFMPHGFPRSTLQMILRNLCAHRDTARFVVTSLLSVVAAVNLRGVPEGPALEPSQALFAVSASGQGHDGRITPRTPPAVAVQLLNTLSLIVKRDPRAATFFLGEPGAERPRLVGAEYVWEQLLRTEPNPLSKAPQRTFSLATDRLASLVEHCALGVLMDVLGAEAARGTGVVAQGLLLLSTLFHMASKAQAEAKKETSAPGEGTGGGRPPLLALSAEDVQRLLGCLGDAAVTQTSFYTLLPTLECLVASAEERAQFGQTLARCVDQYGSQLQGQLEACCAALREAPRSAVDEEDPKVCVWLSTHTHSLSLDLDPSLSLYFFVFLSLMARVSRSPFTPLSRRLSDRMPFRARPLTRSQSTRCRRFCATSRCCTRWRATLAPPSSCTRPGINQQTE
jgi:hypothetical protein